MLALINMVGEKCVSPGALAVSIGGNKSQNKQSDHSSLSELDGLTRMNNENL